MNLATLADNTRKKFVESGTLSPSRDISYQRLSDLVSIPKKCFISGGEFSKADDKNYNHDMEMFSTIYLDVEPVQGDIITYLGKEWKVMFWVGHNPYNVTTVKNKRNRNRNPAKRK